MHLTSTSTSTHRWPRLKAIPVLNTHTLKRSLKSPQNRNVPTGREALQPNVGKNRTFQGKVSKKPIPQNDKPVPSYMRSTAATRQWKDVTAAEKRKPKRTSHRNLLTAGKLNCDFVLGIYVGLDKINLFLRQIDLFLSYHYIITSWCVFTVVE